MTLTFSRDELEGMKEGQEAHMMDEVQHLVYSSSKDALNADVPAWTPGALIACGIDMTGGSEQRDGGRIVVRWDARLRLPIGTSFDMRDRFQVAMRHGQAPTSSTVYEIVSPPEYGPSGILLELRKIEPSEG